MIAQLFPSSDDQFLIGLALVLMTGLLFGKIAKWLHIPSITGYLVGGMLLGPGLFALFNPSYPGILSTNYIHQLRLIADIELAIIAFTIGTEFKFEYLKKLGPAPIIIAFLETFFAVAFITIGLLMFGFPLYLALAFGAVGGATAPAATVMVIRQYKAKGPLTEMIYSVVAIDDASGLIFFGIISAVIHMLVGNPSDSVALLILAPFLEIILSVVIGICIGLSLVQLMKWFTGRGNRSAIIVAMVFTLIAGSRLLSSLLHLEISSLIAAMVIGTIFTNKSPHVETVMPLVERLTPPLVIMFFTLSGADVQFDTFTWMSLAMLTIYLIFRTAGKLSGSYVGAVMTKSPDNVKKYLGFGLLPQGGIALGLSIIVIDMLPVSLNLAYDGTVVRTVVIGAVLISEIFGPIALKKVLIQSKEAQIHLVK
jgi:Kef-type K+ transport system membrane component KefB